MKSNRRDFLRSSGGVGAAAIAGMAGLTGARAEASPSPMPGDMPHA